jgi:hypothetical protein
VSRFTTRPMTGQHFNGTVLEATARQIYIELPGLSGDEWMGIAAPADRKLREGEAVLCEVTGVRQDPENSGGWLVDCRVL